ncbi:MAG: hypothetical protein JG718_06980 [Candidatus Thiothrix moscowensis]|nr:hypothetical protein [Candidatus Thiothrix moscowensis]
MSVTYISTPKNQPPARKGANVIDARARWRQQYPLSTGFMDRELDSLYQATIPAHTLRSVWPQD